MIKKTRCEQCCADYDNAARISHPEWWDEYGNIKTEHYKEYTNYYDALPDPPIRTCVDVCHLGYLNLYLCETHLLRFLIELEASDT